MDSDEESNILRPAARQQLGIKESGGDFIPADDVLEKFFSHENSAEGMDSDEESNILRPAARQQD